MAYRIDFNAAAVNESNKADLIDMLETHRGRKFLYYDPSIVGFFNDPFIVDGLGYNANILKNNFVLQCTELQLDHVPNSSFEVDIESVDCILFIIRPSFLAIKSVARYVQYFNNQKFRGQSHIYYVPQRTNICDQLLHDFGVFEYVEIHELDLGFLAYDVDILSMQLPDYYKDVHTDGDYSSINYIASG